MYQEYNKLDFKIPVELGDYRKCSVFITTQI